MFCSVALNCIKLFHDCFEAHNTFKKTLVLLIEKDFSSIAIKSSYYGDCYEENKLYTKLCFEWNNNTILKNASNCGLDTFYDTKFYLKIEST